MSFGRSIISEEEIDGYQINGRVSSVHRTVECVSVSVEEPHYNQMAHLYLTFQLRKRQAIQIHPQHTFTTYQKKLH